MKETKEEPQETKQDQKFPRERPEQRRDQNLPREETTELLTGRHAVEEALRAQRPANALFVSQEAGNGRLGALLALARASDVLIKQVTPQKLEKLVGGHAHQGVVLSLAPQPFAELEDLFVRAEERQQAPFFVICDEIEDPHNLGAIIRTAEAAGVHGVIVPRHRSAPLSLTTAKAAAGALSHLPICRVTNLTTTLTQLKARGLWIYGADMSGASYRDQTFEGALALVIGAEGKGLGRLVREHCDVLVSLPMQGQIASLNASVAAGILLYKILEFKL